MPLTTEWTTDTANVTSTVSVNHHTSTPLDGNRSVRFNITTAVNVGASDPTDTFALEVEWKADLDIFGGTSIICRYGVDLDNLDVVLEYVDETSPLLVSSAEGLFAFRSGTSVVGQAIFDDTSMYDITLS